MFCLNFNTFPHYKQEHLFEPRDRFIIIVIFLSNIITPCSSSIPLRFLHGLRPSHFEKASLFLTVWLSPNCPLVFPCDIRNTLRFLLMYGFRRMLVHRKRLLGKQAFQKSFSRPTARTQCSNIFSIKIPYPLVGSLTRT